MVAVDARWLSRSLEAWYPEFFGVTDRKHDDQDNPIEPATPADYLEKIFQIPYWVPPMTEDTSKALVGDLIAADRIPFLGSQNGEKEEQKQDEVQKKNGDLTKGRDARAGDGTQVTDEDNQPQDLPPPQRALGLTEAEIDVLTRLSPFLGGSPRRARRFVNVYRVAKASLTPAEVRMLEQGEHQALATQLAIATGAPNAFASWMDLYENPAGGSIEDRIAELSTDEDECANIQGALRIYAEIAQGVPDAEKRLALQGTRAARFSFAVPRKGSVVQPKGLRVRLEPVRNAK
jgi:hypothetical protein